MPFKIIRNDITKTKADAIVNTANPRPVIGGGTDTAIYNAAGRTELLKERKRIGVIERGEAVATPAFRLPARYIIHTVGPVWRGGEKGEEKLLEACYANSLNLAWDLGCESIAFPMISTGIYGFPKDLALQIILSVVSGFLADHDMMIYLVVFEKRAVRLSERLFEKIESRIDDRYVEEKLREEYKADYSNLSGNLPRPSAGRLESFRSGRAKSSKSEYKDSMRRPASSYSLRDDDYPPEPYAGVSEYPDSDTSYGESSDLDMSYSDASETFVSYKYAPDSYDSYSDDPDLDVSYKYTSVSKPAKRTLEDVMKQSDETFSQMLLRLIREKGFTNAQVYKKANQDKKLFSKIKKNINYQPSKKTAMAFALGLELNYDEAKDLLARAGYAFSPSSNFDKAIRFFIETKEYNIYEIEIILYDLGLETLCNY